MSIRPAIVFRSDFQILNKVFLSRNQNKSLSCYVTTTNNRIRFPWNTIYPNDYHTAHLQRQSRLLLFPSFFPIAGCRYRILHQQPVYAVSGSGFPVGINRFWIMHWWDKIGRNCRTVRRNFIITWIRNRSAFNCFQNVHDLCLYN